MGSIAGWRGGCGFLACAVGLRWYEVDGEWVVVGGGCEVAVSVWMYCGGRLKTESGCDSDCYIDFWKEWIEIRFGR